uniref:Uncharacterized protein n=1 Tax=Arundo donax TaxID=35708 RepID=A0A0A8YRD3_ARUDO
MQPLLVDVNREAIVFIYSYIPCSEFGQEWDEIYSVPCFNSNTNMQQVFLGKNNDKQPLIALCNPAITQPANWQDFLPWLAEFPIYHHKTEQLRSP